MQGIARHRIGESMPRTRLRLEAAATRAAIVATIVAFLAFLATYAWTTVQQPFRLGMSLEVGLFLAIVTFLVYGGLVYLTSRLGYLMRRLDFVPASAEQLRGFSDRTKASMTVLIPSYKEEPEVIRMTLLSAALQRHPKRRVVLLIDDPPLSGTEEEQARLASTRSLPGELQRLLDEARAPFARASVQAHAAAGLGSLDPSAEAFVLARLYERAGRWFEEQAERHAPADHTQELFVETNLRRPAAEHRRAGLELQRRAARRAQWPSQVEILRHHRHLDSLFRVELSSFERKRYANLSHAANKAMNLNSYIALLGERVIERRVGDELELWRAENDEGIPIPATDYVLTLDADSIVLPDYALHLVHLLERTDNTRVAAAQTPYSAVPGSPRVLERIAGATTDIQYLLHQGFTRHRATFWVGANAVLRMRALHDIAKVVRDQRTGLRHGKYIQDRTVIEDTESSVDLVERGWELFNYPARLSYSATPPDFGALVIQRRRWANGGLLILPKLLRALLRGRRRGVRVSEGLLRVHYLTSIAAVNIGLALLFLFPFDPWFASPWLPLTAAPYFLLYMHDLRLAGYSAGDLLRVYALNLLLIPVNLGGVLKSFHQACTGRMTPFKRTPKVRDRTPAPAVYVVAPALLVLYLAGGLAYGVAEGNWAVAVAAGINGALLLYALGMFVGFREARQDSFNGLLRAAQTLYGVLPATVARAVSVGATLMAASVVVAFGVLPL
jgi:cellulose synthase (UDP-forming)